MKLGRYASATCLFLTLFIPSAAICSDWTMPERGEKIELILKSGEVLTGTIIDVDSKHISIMREDTLAGEVRIPTAAIAGIRHPGDADFHTLSGEALPSDFHPLAPPLPAGPRTMKVRVYDKLPLMGVAIIGGVFAGDRFGKASSERDLADSLRKVGLDDDARALEDRADDHTAQAWIGVLIGAAGLLIACIPSYQEIPLPVVAAQAGDAPAFSIAFDLTRLCSAPGKSNSRSLDSDSTPWEPMVSPN